ncbi:MAG: hypothetical protein J6B85_08910 [Lachnospiraceae bacterium]|nr:hypothetical protein [Lachnospiraceae bacterium]
MIIRQSAFAGSERMLKGGLHCHTTRSDGKGTPEEVIRLHYENGYDFMTLTDHFIYNYKNYAPEIPITIIPGVELGGMVERDHGFRTFHSVCIGPNNETNGFAQDEKIPSADQLSPNKIVKDQYEYQPYLDMIHEKNNLTIYCHPEWSSTPARYFENMKGNFAMEIWNTGCVQVYDIDKDAAYWDEVLGQGKRIWGVASDDGHKMEQHCGGWVMVRAENNVDAILAALERGDFYSSCGPKIYDFYVEDGVAHVKCDPSCMVKFHADRHPSVCVRGEGLTEAECKIGEGYYYVRASITDAQGRKAWTNPIFLD